MEILTPEIKRARVTLSRNCCSILRARQNVIPSRNDHVLVFNQWQRLNRFAIQFLNDRFPAALKLKKRFSAQLFSTTRLIAQAIEMLKPSDFYVPSHRRIFTAMIALFERGSEINPILIAEELRRDNSLDSSGGVIFLTNLTYGLPHVTSIAQYCESRSRKVAAAPARKGREQNYG